MVFAKPTTELTEEDIKSLLERKEPEQITLDYKERIEVTDHFKKELAKDVSAFANSRGGYLLLGIEEKDGRPIRVIGMPRMLGQQKVEEWIEQTALSNISPRVAFEVKPILLTGSGDVVVVLHVRESRRAPHMVTFQHDNRYYRRYNNHSLPAEEYEVRELFERGKRFTEKVEQYLKSRSYDTPENQNFALNEWTRRLRYLLPDGNAAEVRSFFTFVSIPLALGDDFIDTLSPDLLKWLDPNMRKLIFTGLPRPTFEGLVFPDEVKGALMGYLLINRNGYVEYCKDGLVWQTPSRNRWIVSLNKTVDYFHAFCRLVDDLYEQPFSRYEQDVRILVNGAGLDSTEAAEVTNYPLGRDFPYYSKSNVQVSYEVEATSLSQKVQEFVSDFSTRLANNYGLSRIPERV